MMDMYQNQKAFTFKVMVIGDPAVGKTSLIRRYVKNKFDEGYSATLGVEFMVKEVTTCDGFQVRLVLWDVAGQSKYVSFKKHYYNGSNFLIIVFDVTNFRTCTNVKKWLRNAQAILGRDIPFAILVNKIDLVETPPISKYYPVFELAAENPNTYLEMMETSAKTSENVNRVFDDIARFLSRRLEY